MARIVIVHGAFNELWGPNELKARWLPAVRDGLWHHGVHIGADDVDVCFYGDLFRHHPDTDEDRRLEQSRPARPTCWRIWTAMPSRRSPRPPAKRCSTAPSTWRRPC